MSSHASECMLKSLEYPGLDGALPGLELVPPSIFGPPQLHLDAKAFQCCGGSGQRAVGPDTQARCELKERKRRVEELLWEFCKLWGEPGEYVTSRSFPVDSLPAAERAKRLPPAIPEGLDTPIFDRLLKLKEKRPLLQCRGISHEASATASGPSYLWTIAAAAVWRFGLHPHMVTLGRSNPLPASDGLKRVQLILVEGVDRLWDTRQVDDFEQIVGLAERAQIPLWLEIHAPKGSEVPTGRRSVMRQRVEKLKQKDPLSWIDPSTRSRLPFLTEGLSSAASKTHRPDGRKRGRERTQRERDL